MQRLLLTFVMLASLLLAGCGGDPKPRFADPTPGVSSSSGGSAPPTSDPSSQQSTPPSTPLTPIALTRRWAAAQQHASRTGDTQALAALSSPTCKTCQSDIRSIAKVYRAGGRIDSAGWIVSKLKLDPHDKAGRTVVAVLTFAAGRTMTSRGATPTVYAAQRQLVLFKTGAAAGADPVITQIVFLS